MEITLPNEELRLRLGSYGLVTWIVAITFKLSINYDVIFRTIFFKNVRKSTIRLPRFLCD
jgi:hypothetical protein